MKSLVLRPPVQPELTEAGRITIGEIVSTYVNIFLIIIALFSKFFKAAQAVALRRPR
jgi:hypothetical protein